MVDTCNHRRRFCLRRFYRLPIQSGRTLITHSGYPLHTSDPKM
jgi:hypothetical protein